VKTTAERIRFVNDSLTEVEIAQLRLAAKQLGDFYLGEALYPPGFKIPMHSHINASLCLMLQGGCTEFKNGKSYECEALSVVFGPPGDTHSEHYHEAGGRCFMVEIRPSWFDRLRDCSIRLNAGVKAQAGPLAWLSLRLHNEFRRMDELSPIAIEGLILEMVAVMARLSSKNISPSRIKQAKEAIEAHFADNISLSFIAEAIGTHPVYLARRFRNEYNCTVGEYIRKLRIDFACKEMTNSDATIAEVALASGFSDQSHFSRTFKRFTGLTPTQFRTSVSQVNPRTTVSIVQDVASGR
jgi:AraC family transcriptional regulator